VPASIAPIDLGMDIAPIPVEASAVAVRNDRERGQPDQPDAGDEGERAEHRVAHAFALGWDMDALGIRPRDVHGLLGILTAPFVHASFEHLMSNTLPLGLLSAFTLYAYPRAARYALPLIWIVSGVGVWLWARPSLHVGISGITHGLMFFLFVIGLLRRDRLGVSIALAVFFLYGGMTMTVLPREESVSFEYHAAGAVAGLISALAFYRLDPAAPRKRYSWEDEEEQAAEFDYRNELDRSGLEPDRPRNVPILWDGPQPRQVGGDNVIDFPPQRERGNPTLH
jgi:membrane associated rhomboid family serine protease